MPSFNFSSRRSGFSLVEILVGLAIGMLAVAIILQVFSLSEKQKRTSTSGGDAQSAGAITFYQLQHDIGQAGYGFTATALFNCNVKWALTSGTNIAATVPLAPVTINPAAAIVPAGDANTDTLLIVYGNTNGEPQGNKINAQAGTVNTVQMPTAFNVGDKVIVAPDACGATQLNVDQIAAVATNTVTVGNASTGTVLYNLGPSPTILAYAVRSGNLTVCDYTVNDCGATAAVANSAVWVPIASNIVSMKAQYARDTSTPMDAIPDVYDRVTPGSALDTSGIAANCGWARTSAIRLAIVARSSQIDKDVVTPSANAPSWAGNDTDPIVAGAGVLGPNTNPDEPWMHYRYKVFQTTVPIRNVAWLGIPTPCQ